MRSILMAAVLGFLLAGCGAVFQNPAPVYNLDYRNQYHARPNENLHIAQKPDRTAPKEQAQPWSITEDRFISTHPPDMSVEALHRSPDEIKSRLKELDKPSS
jgi:hypothetical protein